MHRPLAPCREESEKWGRKVGHEIGLFLRFDETPGWGSWQSICGAHQKSMMSGVISIKFISSLSTCYAKNLKVEQTHFNFSGNTTSKWRTSSFKSFNHQIAPLTKSKAAEEHVRSKERNFCSYSDLYITDNPRTCMCTSFVPTSRALSVNPA